MSVTSLPGMSLTACRPRRPARSTSLPKKPELAWERVPVPRLSLTGGSRPQHSSGRRHLGLSACQRHQPPLPPCSRARRSSTRSGCGPAEPPGPPTPTGPPSTPGPAPPACAPGPPLRGPPRRVAAPSLQQAQQTGMRLHACAPDGVSYASTENFSPGVSAQCGGHLCAPTVLLYHRKQRVREGATKCTSGLEELQRESTVRPSGQSRGLPACGSCLLVSMAGLCRKPFIAGSCRTLLHCNCQRSITTYNRVGTRSSCLWRRFADYAFSSASRSALPLLHFCVYLASINTADKIWRQSQHARQVTGMSMGWRYLHVSGTRPLAARSHMEGCGSGNEACRP